MEFGETFEACALRFVFVFIYSVAFSEFVSVCWCRLVLSENFGRKQEYARMKYMYAPSIVFFIFLFFFS